jgi:acetylornithine/succinyldiaminopimelate/putrescine aminotransferase
MVYGEMIQSPQTELVFSLGEVLPEQLNSVYLVNSGSEAIEGALKLAKRYSGRTEIIAFKNAYHGGTHGALSITGDESLKNAFRPLLPSVFHLRYNHLEDLEFITERTACVVVEAIQAEAGIILPEKGFLEALNSRCKETGTLLILDDIQMGMGRTGKMFSFQHFGFEPDILVLAKAFGGGMPLGAFIAPHTLMKTLTFLPELGHITTFGGHPVSCAAAHAALNLIRKEKLEEKAEKKGNLFREALIDHPRIQSVRQIGLMLGLDLESTKLAARLVQLFITEGLITDRFLFRPKAFRIAPPLTITKTEIDESIGRIRKALDKL